MTGKRKLDIRGKKNMSVIENEHSGFVFDLV